MKSELHENVIHLETLVEQSIECFEGVYGILLQFTAEYNVRCVVRHIDVRVRAFRVHRAAVCATTGIL